MNNQTERPLVSIISPSYNQGEFLEHTIQSVLRQDYPEIEYILVDGGSTDGSQEIITKYHDRMAWWVSETDRGQAEAINKGLSKARGEIIAWLNSDDLYLPGAVSQAVKALQSEPELGLVYGDALTVDAGGHPLNRLSFGDWELRELLRFRIICQPAVFMRRRVLEQAGLLDESYHFMLDHHLWLRMAIHAPIRHMASPWAAARHHPGAKNIASATEFSAEIYRLLEWIANEPTLGDFWQADCRRISGAAHRLSARYLLDGGAPGPALSAYLKALLAYPSFALQHWHRMVYALLSLAGLGRLNAWYYRMSPPRSFGIPPIAQLARPGTGWLTINAEPRTNEPKISGSTRFEAIPEASVRPILVTGAHRSGTTWVGKILAASPETAYISEPLNVLHRPGVLDAPVSRWYTYIHAGNEADYLPAFRKLLRLEYGLGRELSALQSRKDLLRMARDAWVFGWGRLSGARPLIKDPFAVFSLGWFIERLGCQVIVTIRHPAAFASSLKRLEWPFDLEDLLQQPQLIQDWLQPYREEMEQARQSQEDALWQAAMLWRMVYSVVGAYREIYPEIRVVRHEDLSLDPLSGFQELYGQTNLPFSEKVKKTILKTSSADNPDELKRQAAHSVRLDSRANLGNWKKRLAPAEIERLRQMTETAAQPYYRPEDWL